MNNSSVWRLLASKQRTAAFTRKAIAQRRVRGLETSQLEGRLDALLHEIELLRIQIRSHSREKTK